MVMSAGKGDKPRNCFSKAYKDNYDNINWGTKRKYEERNIKRIGSSIQSTKNQK